MINLNCIFFYFFPISGIYHHAIMFEDDLMYIDGITVLVLIKHSIKNVD